MQAFDIHESDNTIHRKKLLAVIFTRFVQIKRKNCIVCKEITRAVETNKPWTDCALSQKHHTCVVSKRSFLDHLYTQQAIDELRSEQLITEQFHQFFTQHWNEYIDSVRLF